MEVTRRHFLAATGSAAAASAAVAVEDKIYDGGLAPVSLPGLPARAVPILPAGAHALKAFKARCTGCQLCVTACPNNVLVPSKRPGLYLLPEMDFRRGHCGLYCKTCGEVCPTGAIEPLGPAARRHVHVGRAVWHPENCLAEQKGETCSACVRHCPVKAIYAVPRDPKKPEGVQIPVVDANACIGCGACEHVCPARPMPGLQVEGLMEHREVKPMGEADVLAEAKRLLNENKAGVVAYRDGVITAHALGRGIGPILKLFDEELEGLRGATVVDKVVGRAAAAICVAAGARHVHGLLISEEARDYLKAHGIAASADVWTPKILNRAKTGPCPMDQAVKDLDDPLKMIAAIRRKKEQLARAAKQEGASK